MKPRPLPSEDPMYPSSDGKPLAENDWQLEAILSALDMLRGHFEERPDVYVSGDLLIYYEEGKPGKAVAPDVFVVLGADKHKRMVYKLWEEPKAPDFVLEVASKNTWREDVGPKRATYAALGIREYWLFDPKGEYWNPPLQGLTLEDGVYRPLGARAEAGRRTLRSTVLGMDVWAENGLVRFRDVGSGEVMRTWSEHRDAHRREQVAREREQVAHERERARLEARIRELEAREG
ncbi:MAG: Uma2 family endonuclease [Gammaproteobacteria bacterium]|nr:Uma2 family endonuclease [Gammaproteobacteria bacterium]MYE80827.1 Uma2 family endonuclease [Gammaproteobacteria bacterium]